MCILMRFCTGLPRCSMVAVYERKHVMTNAVEVNGLYKRFGTFEALRGLSLNVEQGITYGLLGPNGAGKTTLIRAIVGLLSPDRGQIKILGTAMPNKNILKRVGYMTQAVALYEEL